MLYADDIRWIQRFNNYKKVLVALEISVGKNEWLPATGIIEEESVTCILPAHS